MSYNHQEIEKKWQAKWEASRAGQVDEVVSRDNALYYLIMFPYPSGSGLHVGHVESMAAMDILARMERMRGKNVLCPIGYDAFGLPAENYAIKTGVHPSVTTKDAIANFHNQMQSLGLSFDWSREISTADPEYYKWTQWLFLLFYKNGLAYRKKSPVNWCEKDQTVLANEQVVNGACDRCGTIVVQKELEQWFFNITKYADRLLAGLDSIDWPEKIKSMQRNWIGKSVGAEVSFVIASGAKQSVRIDKIEDPKDSFKFTPELTELVRSGKKAITIRLEKKNLHVGDAVQLMTRFSPTETRAFAHANISSIESMLLKNIPLNLDGHESYVSYEEMLSAFQNYYGKDISLETEFVVYYFSLTSPIVTVFTTRPDTLFGATYLVLAPEHSLVDSIVTDEQRVEVEAYRIAASKKSALERTELQKEKTGVFTGSYAINPANGESIPVWIADYVITTYGTGAIMAVPAHDERDFEFAKKYSLSIKQVVAQYFLSTDIGAPRPEVETLERRTVDAVIESVDGGEFLLEVEGEHVHFMGGGVEEGESLQDALAREIKEETGYVNFEIQEMILENNLSLGYRHTKNKNQNSNSASFYVRLLSNERVASEIEEGKHEIIWVPKKDIGSKINWEIHHAIWNAFLQHNAYVGDGRLVNSDFLNGLSTNDAKQKMIQWLEENHFGNAKTTFRLRDWLVSRQRYWGAPIPIIWCEEHGAQAVDEATLPVELPTDVDFKPTGESPLVDSKTFHDVKCPMCGKDARRESDTMDTFVDSSWYYLRYTDPHNAKSFADKSKIDYWCPVDLYLGGAEHAVMHLLYARFFAYALHDLGYLGFEEPFLKLKNQGLILGPDGDKMSKSKGNVVNPDEVVSEYGADALRLYEMFMGPLEDAKPWDTKGVVGVRRFLDKVYNVSLRVRRSNLFSDEQIAPSTSSGNNLLPEPVEGLNRLLHKTIKKVTKDLEDLKFNTAISQLMIVTNEFSSATSVDKESFETFLKLLAPLAPHLAEELWEKLGHAKSIFCESWPTFDATLIIDDVVEMGVQVNGKVRATIRIAPNADEATAKELAFANVNVMKWIEGKEIAKIVYVPGKIFNMVVK